MTPVIKMTITDSRLYFFIAIAGLVLSASALPSKNHVFSGLSQVQQMSNGTCVGASHTSGCCIPAPSSDCSVSVPNSNDPCYCDKNCHKFGDCCPDIQLIRCFPEPVNCLAAGYSRGCCIRSDENDCYVHGGKCYCDETCYIHDDCCTDIRTVGCVPSRCETAGREPGNCTNNCFVPGGSPPCYCDPFCCQRPHNDCCTDVNVTETCPTDDNVNGQSREVEYNNKERITSTKIPAENYKEEVVSRLPNVKGDRARTRPRVTSNSQYYGMSSREREVFLQHLAKEIEDLREQLNDKQN